ASGVARRAAAVPVALISGLADGAVLGAPTTVRVDVSHPRVVESVELLVDGRAVALGIDSTGLRAALLDPSALEAGEHEAVVRATWTSDGEPLAFEGTPVRFTAAASGPITWLDNVEPLHRARCAICHDNGTETILADRDAWVVNVDRILTEVEAARMPLGGDPLDEATIGVIRTWRDTDFP
ncbi:MAG: hypothetical protein KC656_14225, partial [Myxococcales bacterium]|nr:hypothetical protein [Myxococcales bacterium]